MSTATILVDSLNIRMKPDGDIIGVVRKGQQFPILKRESLLVCDWLQIKVSGDLVGWIAEVNKRDSKRFVKVDETPDNAAIPVWVWWALGAVLFIAIVIGTIWP